MKTPTGKIRLFDWLSCHRSARTRELILHGVSLLIALILVSAAYGHLAGNPLKSALILALFGCGYAVARQVFKDALYVYPTLALWTFAFFLACYAVGAPTILFPVVATLLIWTLWIGTLFISAEEEDFSRAVHRSIFIATVFFGCWAKIHHGAQSVIPAATFILYGLSLTCFHLLRPRRLHAYTAGICLAVGAFYCSRITGLLAWPQYGAAIQPMVLFMLLIAVFQHGQNKYRQAFPYYLNAMALSVVCLGISVIGWRHLLDQFALTAVTLGAPVLVLRRNRKPSSIEAYALISGLSFAAQACLLAAVPLVVVAPLLSFGNALGSSVLMAVFCLFCILEHKSDKPLTCVKRTAFFAAFAGAWIAGLLLEGAPSLAGVAGVAVLWLGASFNHESRQASVHGRRDGRVCSHCHGSCSAGCHSAILLPRLMCGGCGDCRVCDYGVGVYRQTARHDVDRIGTGNCTCGLSGCRTLPLVARAVDLRRTARRHRPSARPPLAQDEKHAFCMGSVQCNGICRSRTLRCIGSSQRHCGALHGGLRGNSGGTGRPVPETEANRRDALGHRREHCRIHDAGLDGTRIARVNAGHGCARAGALPYRGLADLPLLVPAWAILGCVTHEKRSADYCRTSAFLGLYLCFTGATQVVDVPGLLFVISLVGFVICLAVQRDRYFIQIVLLALALVGFTWIRECGTHFTQELYSVMLVILGIAMAAELSPYLVRHLDRSIPIPYVRLFTWRGVGVGVIVGIMVTLVCISGFALAVTEHPAFCKSCHNMDQFFDSWQHSSHGEVACVECHYEPGLVALVEGKIGAMSQLVSFLTHRYGAKPHAEVSNKACQQPGCHSDIEENTDVFYDDRIHFSHDLHHDAMIKGKSLPCTTCHSQEQRDEHIEVSSSTCFLCHFHGTGPAAEKTADCKSCHDAPRGAAGEAAFDHEDFFAGRTDVDCHHCHMRVNQGDASVSAIRCQSCHYGNQLAVVDLTEVKALHDAHVHERQIGCFECHNVLKHGITTKASPLDAQQCATCHSERQHSLQTAMYLGTAAKDVAGEPNVMYDADISCNHCHVQEKEISLDGHVFTTRVSTADNCSACHGDEDYKEMYETWQEEAAEAIAQLKTDLEQARATVDKAGTGKTADDARQLLNRADELHEIIRRDGSSGVHNILYVEEILSEARSKMRMAEASVGAVNP